MKLGEIKHLDPEKKSYVATFGKNMGNQTFGLDLSIREMMQISRVRNLAHEDDEGIAQRELDQNHARGLARHTIVGLVQTQIHRDRSNGLPVDSFKNLQQQIGHSPYAVLQPMVCNIRGCARDGMDLDFDWIQEKQPNGDIIKLDSVIKVHLGVKHTMSVVDGQHRRAGFDIALKWLTTICNERKYPATLINLTDTVSRGDTLPDEIYAFWQRVLDIALGESHIKVECHLGLGAQEERQLFADLNNKGKSVDVGLALSFDRSDAINTFVAEELLPDLEIKTSPKDSSIWEQDTGTLLRKDINPITCLVMFGKPSYKDVTPAQVNARKSLAFEFWNNIKKIRYFGEASSRQKIVAAQPVVLQSIAKLAFDLAYGKGTLQNNDDLKKLWLSIRDGSLDFSHSNPIWSSLMLSKDDRAKKLDGINNYIHVPFGTNLDAGTYDPETGWVRYGIKKNDIRPRLGDAIRYQLGFKPRQSVTKAIASGK
tara:strand:- start:106 stop:1551 length:1446 start_codon:yes stop_codon:yes gene_type:complete